MSATSAQDHLLARPMVIARISAAAIPSLIVLGCAALASTAPIAVSMVVVFLFAGPHNWLEARYLMTRMPARWGMLGSYFALGVGGSLLLACLFAATPRIAGRNPEFALALVATWNTLFTFWVMRLALLRSRQNPRRDWQFLIPLGFSLVAVNWLCPLAWSLVLVYLHPILALVFMDRELTRQRSVWLGSFRVALCFVPLCLMGLAACWATSPDLAAQDLVAWQITHHAGAGVIPHVSTHFLVAAHIFLELLHYLVWIVVMPTIGVRGPFWMLNDVPLARRSRKWQMLLKAFVLAGLGIVLILWGSFLSDYAWTRDVYFTIAILHVLAEFPFLLRLL